MNLILKLDPSLPRVAVGSQVSVWKNGKVIGGASVIGVDGSTATFNIELEAANEDVEFSKHLGSESTKSTGNDFVIYEDFKYYIGVV
jgi:hypothetical protein